MPNGATQHLLPLNPAGFDAVPPDLALNTAVSFVTSTSWQSYGGETTLNYLSQMTTVTVQSFLSVASGIAVVIALIRGFARRKVATVGNFWVDVTRGTLYVLLPIAAVATLFLVWQGVPQTLSGSVAAATLDGGSRIIARGPVASQEAIKLMSGDGSGFFNANSAHPYENPAALSNFVGMTLIFVLGAALTNCFGRMIAAERQGSILLGVMAVLFLPCTAGVYALEAYGNPAIEPSHVLRNDAGLCGGNMEGKEVRFGIAGSALFAEISTASSDGAVDSISKRTQRSRAPATCRCAGKACAIGRRPAPAAARSGMCRTLHSQLATATFRALSYPAMPLRLLWPAAWMSRMIGWTLAANCAACALRAPE
jgi:potassium-transporting ATPase potassium-binding subunit